MNYEELKEALQNQRKVVIRDERRGDFKGRCVSAVIYRWINFKLQVEAEVIDTVRNNCRIIVKPEDVSYDESGESNE